MYRKTDPWTLLIVQWLGICLPLQGTQVPIPGKIAWVPPTTEVSAP